MSGDEGDESEDEAANETAADKRLRIGTRRYTILINILRPLHIFGVTLES